MLRILVLSIVFAWDMHAAGQVANWPPESWRDTVAQAPGRLIPVHQALRGYVLFKNGDSVSGMIKIRYNTSDCFVLKEHEFQRKRFRVKQGKYIRAFVSSLGSAYAELFTFDRKHMRNWFWRLVKKKDSIAIFDRSTGIFTDKPMRAINISASQFNDHMYVIA